MTEPKHIPLTARMSDFKRLVDERADALAEKVWHAWEAIDAALVRVLQMPDDARDVEFEDDPTEKEHREPEVWGGGCECWVTPEHLWTTHYGAVEPGSQLEFNPECPKHGEANR